MTDFNSRFCKIKEISSRVCHVLFEATDLITKNRVIIKEATGLSKCLNNEIKILQLLQSNEELKCIPKLILVRKEKGAPKAIAMMALGLNLEQIFNNMERRMPLRLILMLADLMINCIEEVHNQDILHCDIRPENFLIGRGKEANKLFLIGFSHAQLIQEYVIPKAEKRICRRVSYQSLQSQLGLRSGYRDDLESIGLVLIYLHEGYLPWQGILTEEDETRFNLITNSKKNIQFDELCRNLPEGFEYFFKLCHRLKNNERPNFEEFRMIFRKIFILNGFKRDGIINCLNLHKKKEEKDSKIEKCLDIFSPKVQNSKVLYKNLKPFKSKYSLLPKVVSDKKTSIPPFEGKEGWKTRPSIRRSYGQILAWAIIEPSVCCDDLLEDYKILKSEVKEIDLCIEI